MIRMYYTIWNAYAERRKKEWEPIILYYIEYIKGPGSLAIVDELSIRGKDWFIFGEFIGMYIDNLVGEERLELNQASSDSEIFMNISSRPSTRAINGSAHMRFNISV